MPATLARSLASSLGMWSAKAIPRWRKTSLSNQISVSISLWRGTQWTCCSLSCTHEVHISSHGMKYLCSCPLYQVVRHRVCKYFPGITWHSEGAEDESQSVAVAEAAQKGGEPFATPRQEFFLEQRRTISIGHSTQILLVE